ncbi:hypothetical protein A2Z41_02865 [Microgenomates group bacterium RBG_19FT_COMBO_39_10]|nr:MAG: hypothetical protein A2Z41_02865 [Microgenomates group bacterium RBG_19FT_COMBO_39_10]
MAREFASEELGIGKESESTPHPLKLYIAGPFDQRDQIRVMMTEIEGMGHQIIYDWTDHLPIKPYEENKKLATKYAKEDHQAAANCDVFVLLPGESGGTTRFSELGMALGSRKVKRIFIVGPGENRSVSFFDPKVERLKSPEELIENISLIKTQKPLLTERQLEVLILYAQGKIIQEIADELNISFNTVKAHLYQSFPPGICQRLGIGQTRIKGITRTRVVIEALQRGIISLDEIITSPYHETSREHSEVDDW